MNFNIKQAISDLLGRTTDVETSIDAIINDASADSASSTYSASKIEERISEIPLSTPTVATGAEVDTGTDNEKMVTPKAIEDSSYAKTSAIPIKATGTEINTGTDDAKFATPKAIVDSDYIMGSRGDEVYIPNIPASGGDGGGVTLGTKSVVADTDMILIYDSEDSNIVKTITFADLRTYLDNYYVRA